MRTTAAAMNAKVSQPTTVWVTGVRNPFTMRRSRAIRMIMKMRGTAATPFTMAAKYSALIVLIPRRFIRDPRIVARARTE